MSGVCDGGIWEGDDWVVYVSEEELYVCWDGGEGDECVGDVYFGECIVSWYWNW